MAYAAKHGTAAATEKFGIHRSTVFAYIKRVKEAGTENGRATPAATPDIPAVSEGEQSSEIDELIQTLERRKATIDKQLQAAIETRDLIRRGRPAKK
ncbi:MAG: hypothetical protein JO323_19535 [Acidobacteriia bacterium]|nr:hypothetical protein [Terriglobia bacterium]